MCLAVVAQMVTTLKPGGQCLLTASFNIEAILQFTLSFLPPWQLTMVDTANRERFQSLTAGYYRRANVILMICSLDHEYTLTRLAKWFAEAQHYKDDSDVVYAVVGMKSDLAENEREVTLDMLNSFAAHCNVSKKYVFEVSAKTGDGVNSMLKVLCTAVVDQYSRGPGAKGTTVSLRTPDLLVYFFISALCSQAVHDIAVPISWSPQCS